MTGSLSSSGSSVGSSGDSGGDIACVGSGEGLNSGIDESEEIPSASTSIVLTTSLGYSAPRVGEAYSMVDVGVAQELIVNVIRSANDINVSGSDLLFMVGPPFTIERTVLFFKQCFET